MSESLFEQMPALTALDAFSVTVEAKASREPLSLRQLQRSFLLPDFSELLGEERFADVALSWSLEGLSIAVFVDKPFEEASYPDFQKGDAIEIFIDTRDLKTAGFVTRFCHHFLVLAQEVHGVRVLELTQFRTEDQHSLCDPTDLMIEGEFEKKSYCLRIQIPAHCLHGYDPLQFDRIGFNYRCHRSNGPPQHFCISSQDYAIEHHPRLWGSVKLKQEGVK